MQKVLCVVCLLFLVSSAYALQVSYMYVLIGYARGYYPWVAVNYCGQKGYGDMFGLCSNPSNLFEGSDCNEPIPLSCERYLAGKHISCDSSGCGMLLKITVPEDFKFVDSFGNVVGDEICVGETVSVMKGVNKGEYWSDGGHEDSPPIYWVDDVEKVMDDVLDYSSNNPDWSGWELSSLDNCEDGHLDELVKAPLSTLNSASTWFSPYPYLGVFLCDMRKVSGDTEYSSGLTVDKLGELNLSYTYKVRCMYYLSATKYYSDCVLHKTPMILQAGPDATFNDWGTHNIFFNSSEDFFKIGEIGLKKRVKVVEPLKPKVEVSVAGADSIKFGESNILRVLVKNTGDVNVSLKSVNSRPLGKLVSCDAGVLKPSQSGECLLSVTPKLGDGVSVQVSYDYKSCGKSQIGLETKTLIASKVLEPVLSEQSYSLGVHGGCENSYYACNKADTQPSLFAGYKCYKTSNGFYTPTTERFNLKFDLSTLPKGLVISGARLNLYSNTVGKSQSVGVYSVDMDWKSVQCVPGGDICARPYCSECAPVYDLGGVLQSGQLVSSADRYSFDVTELIKDKYVKGDSSVSLQVRGVEGLWESGGQSMCSVPDNWENLDVSFDSVSGNGPYLEIVYH